MDFCKSVFLQNRNDILIFCVIEIRKIILIVVNLDLIADLIRIVDFVGSKIISDSRHQINQTKGFKSSKVTFEGLISIENLMDVMDVEFVIIGNFIYRETKQKLSLIHKLTARCRNIPC